MRAILSAAGLDEARLSLIKPIVDTCRECRCWQRPGNKNVVSASLPTKFLEEGECDIMFYNSNAGPEKKIFHIIDRAIRLADGQLITDKTTETFLTAYVDSWFKRNGPFKTLYSDGESALNCEAAKDELKRLGKSTWTARSYY